MLRFDSDAMRILEILRTIEKIDSRDLTLVFALDLLRCISMLIYIELIVELNIRYIEIIMSREISKKRTIDGEVKTPDSVSYTLYVNNLNDKIQLAMLKHNLYVYFSTYGDIIDIVMKAQGKMRGQAHIIFANVMHATNAMKSLQGKPFFEKDLHIEYSLKKSKIISNLENDQED